MGRYEQNARRYDKWRKEGRGSGTGAAYLPWLNVYDVPSQGRSHRVFSKKCGRVLHCMSDLEFSAFLLLEWSEHVTDIREQYPLAMPQTQFIADSLGFRHPQIRGEQMVMTTDFLVNTSNPNAPLLAIQVKPSSELLKARVCQKLLIEKSFWKDNNVPFEVLTEQELNTVKTENLRWLSPFLNEAVSIEYISETLSFWEDIFSQNPDSTMVNLASEIDRQQNNEYGSSLLTLRVLLAHRYLTFDFDIPFFEVLASELSIVSSGRCLCA